ncbi:hypothetical protein FRC12_000164 [Ceratobasidium sp. 428]|nr:hypothetical protein FRC12_000164 [Ceratobasidium sp. 428]
MPDEPNRQREGARRRETDIVMDFATRNTCVEFTLTDGLFRLPKFLEAQISLPQAQGQSQPEGGNPKYPARHCGKRWAGRDLGNTAPQFPRSPGLLFGLAWSSSAKQS